MVVFPYLRGKEAIFVEYLIYSKHFSGGFINTVNPLNYFHILVGDRIIGLILHMRNRVRDTCLDKKCRGHSVCFNARSDSSALYYGKRKIT